MKQLSILIFSALLFCISCKTKEEKNDSTSSTTVKEQVVKTKTPQVLTNSDFDINQYFENIKKVDNCLGEKESFDVLGKRLDTVIKAPLDAIETASDLKVLYYKAVELKASTAPPANGRCADTNEAVKQRSIQKLGKMANQEAAVVLIELYKDKQLSFLRGEGRVLTNAMIQCGSSITPLLEPIKDQRPKISAGVLKN